MNALSAGVGARGAERHDAVDIGVGAQGRLDGGLRTGRVGQLDRQHVRGGHAGIGEGVGEALAAQVEGDVADLLVDTHAHGHARGSHLLAAAVAGLVLGLTDVHEDAQVLVDVGARVHRDDRDAGFHGRHDRRAQRVSVRERDDEAVRLRCHGGSR